MLKLFVTATIKIVIFMILTDNISYPYLSMEYRSGRGGAVNSHPGNRRYRDLVTFMKAEYLNESTRKNEKTHISANIVWTIRNGTFPGRFLKQDPKTKLWHEIGDKAAFRKTGQALRENSAEFLRSKEEEQSASTNAMRSIWNQHLSFPSD